MGLLYWRAGRLTDKNGGFRPRAVQLEGLGTAEDGLSACCADDAGQAVTWRASSGVCFLPGRTYDALYVPAAGSDDLRQPAPTARSTARSRTPTAAATTAAPPATPAQPARAVHVRRPAASTAAARSDCAKGQCEDSVCTSCFNTIADGYETGADCGGRRSDRRRRPGVPRTASSASATRPPGSAATSPPPSSARSAPRTTRRPTSTAAARPAAASACSALASATPATTSAAR